MSPGRVTGGRVTSAAILSRYAGVTRLEEVMWVARMIGPDEGEASAVHIRRQPPTPAPVPGQPLPEPPPMEPSTLCGLPVPEDQTLRPRPEDPRCRSCHRLSQRYGGPAVLERM